MRRTIIHVRPRRRHPSRRASSDPHHSTASPAVTPALPQSPPGLFFDRGGRPISFHQYLSLLSDLLYCNVAYDSTPSGDEVRTHWVGFDLSCPSGTPPQIFSTEVYNRPHQTWRNELARSTSSEADAITTHHHLLQQLLPPSTEREPRPLYRTAPLPSGAA